MSVRRRTWTTPRGERREAWLVAYIDQAGARRFETFDRRRDADARDAEIKVDLRRGTHTPISTGDTIAAAFANWIEHCRAEGLERSTIRQREINLRLHVEPFLGNVKLATLTVPRVHSSWRSCAMAGARWPCAARCSSILGLPFASPRRRAR